MPYIEEIPSGFGALQSVRHSAILSKLAFWPVRPCHSAVTLRNGRHANRASGAVEPAFSNFNVTHQRICIFRVVRDQLGTISEVRQIVAEFRMFNDFPSDCR